jgi:hypothetical protein
MLIFLFTALFKSSKRVLTEFLVLNLIWLYYFYLQLLFKMSLHVLTESLVTVFYCIISIYSSIEETTLKTAL